MHNDSSNDTSGDRAVTRFAFTLRPDDAAVLNRLAVALAAREGRAVTRAEVVREALAHLAEGMGVQSCR